MTPEEEIRELRSRIERLEQMAGLAVPQPSPTVPPDPVPAPAAITPPPLPENPAPIPAPPPETSVPLPPAPPVPALPKSVTSSEQWLARIGIGLFLIGFLFFLKLSLDRGWITPQLQLLAASAGCLALLVVGDRLGRGRPALGHLAFGGGIVGLFATAIAGQYLYQLYGGATTCALTAGAALLCFAQSLRRRTPDLCVLATLGLFVSPLFLGSGAALLYALDAALAGSLALATYFFLGWRRLVTVGGAGVWLMLLQAAITANRSEQPAVQVVIAFCALAFWLVPLLRLLRRPEQDRRTNAVLWATAFLPALTAVGWGNIMFGNDRFVFGTIFVLLALLSGAVGWFLRQRSLGWAASPQFVGTSIFLTAAIMTLLDGFSCWLTFAVFAAVLHRSASITGEKPLAVVAHLASLFAFAMLCALAIALAGARTWTAGNVLSVLALTASLAATAWLNRPRESADLYRIAAHLGLLALIAAATISDHLSLPHALPCAAVIGVLARFGWLTSPSPVLTGFSHLVFAALTPFVAWMLFFSRAVPPWWNREALSALVILAAALALGKFASHRTITRAYLWTAYAVWLLLLYVEFSTIGRGSLVSVSWAVSAVVLIIRGVRVSSRAARLGGLATLLLMLLRLFTVDLALLDLATKTLIFLGIGLLLFAVGYFLPRFLPARPSDTD